MALVLKDRVQETTTVTGTGTLTLLGAVTGYQSFAAIGNANTTYYTIAGQGTAEWEVGIGTYTASGTTLSRATILASSNAGSLVNFSPGTKNVFCTYPSSRSIYADGATLTASNSSVLPAGSGGTGISTVGTTGNVLTSNGTIWVSSLPSVTAVSDQDNTSTGYFDLPAGTTAQRPGSPTVGMVRYNTTLARYEGYTNAGWQNIFSYTTYPASYLIIAGGGCGGGQNGGGAGAGGMLEGTTTLTPGTVYNVVVGAGGVSSQGANTTALGLTAIGGGEGNNGSGGSGGGGASSQGGGAGTSGQGNNGGAGIQSGFFPGGGGGGKGAVGGNAPNTSTGGTGGAGAASSITGTSVTYAGGGGGGVNPGSGGPGGSGGGGAGSTASGSPTPGTVNTGGGGGGGNNNRAGTGGSGIVIFAVPTIFYTGTTTGSPTITTSGANTIISFLSSSGSYTA